MSTESTGGSRQPRTNSVKSATAENSTSEEMGSYQERTAERAGDCVEQFRRQYPELANLPLSEQPGRSLRSEVVEETYVEEYVDGTNEWDQGFTTHRLDRAEPVTWAEALYEFLTTRAPYDDGLCGRFCDTVADESFVKGFSDCWTTAYGDEQAAKNKGAQRQLMGGDYPEHADSARWGEEEEGVWSDDIATILMTRTGSSLPEGDRVPPADQFAAVTKTWSDGVYDVVRNVCEYHLGLESDQWGYVRGDDVHGLPEQTDGSVADAQGTEHHTEGGQNACYAHAHDGIYIDLEGTDLRETFDSDDEIKTVLQSQFYKGIEKHLELCDLADEEAHPPEESVEVMLSLEQPAGYATGYLRLDEDEDMLDRAVEFQAFAAVEWAMSRQRLARSQLFSEAANADLCKQDKDVQHGDRLRYDHSGHGDSELVCSHCGSPIGIEGDTMTEHRLAEASSQPAVVADGGQVAVGASIGERTEKAAVRSAVEDYVQKHGEPESIPAMLGELEVSPDVETAKEVLNGEDGPSVEPVMGQPRPPPQYELESIISPDGSEEPASSGGGGPETTELVLPVERLLQETRLRHVGNTEGWPTIEVEIGDERLATSNPKTAAGWLVSQGCRRPWHAELALTFTRYGKGTSEVFDEPEAEPPR